MDKTVQWLYSAELPGGGLSAWRTEDGRWHDAYPEVSGYLLPTLIKWGAGDLAIRTARWLLKQQHPDGYWLGLDGVPRAFDTAAVLEGLTAMYEWSAQYEYIEAVIRARTWMQGQIQPGGWLSVSPTDPGPQVYTLRASALIDNRRELHHWRRAGLIHGRENRTHYLAYALEGALKLNDADLVRPHLELAKERNPGLMPFFVDGQWSMTHPADDLCATAQMGILFERVGLDAAPTYAALKARVCEDGGVWQSTSDRRQILWAAKYFLDFKELME